MSSSFKLPQKRGAVFWPVGTGDSTTFVLRPGQLIMQVDIRHLEKADSAEEPEWSILDELVRILPKKDGKPYLAVFALTHPDKDHVAGFAELLKKVHIGELWHTPKVFRDQSDQEALCPDAIAFRKEAARRRDAILKNPDNIQSGNRLRIIGHDDILHEERYKDIPEACKSRPGEIVTTVDGISLSGEFQAFIHAPFKADQAKNKNNTSLSMNVVLWHGEKYAQFMLFGDREHPTIKQIFETTEALKDNISYLFWDVMLCSHHCSKGVMYWKDPPEEDETFRKDIMDYFEKYSRNKAGYIVASCEHEFDDKPGSNPPHLKARKKYEGIVEAGHFLCVHEYPNKTSPSPLVFTIDEEGFKFDDERKKTNGPARLAAAVQTARGSSAPPSTQVGFGQDK